MGPFFRCHVSYLKHVFGWFAKNRLHLKLIHIHSMYVNNTLPPYFTALLSMLVDPTLQVSHSPPSGRVCLYMCEHMCIYLNVYLH